MNTNDAMVATSNEETFASVAADSNMNTHSNVSGGELVYPTSGTKVGNTYYSYSMKSDNGSYGTDSVADSGAEQTKYFGTSSKPIYFSGSNAFSISIRARSDMDFSNPYFTLGLGNNSTQYHIFKLGKDAVRFQMTNNSWMGETGIKKSVNGTQWHTYMITVDETVARLYVDKELVGENYTMGALLSDFALSKDNVADMKNTVYNKENGSSGGTTGGETTGTYNLWKGSCNLKSWTNPLEISNNLNGKNAKQLKISYTCYSGTQLQISCIDKNGNWKQFVDCVDVSGDSYAYTIGSAELATLQTAQKIIIKGQNATVTAVDVIGTQGDTSGGGSSSDSGNKPSGGDSSDSGNTTTGELITDKTNGILFDDGSWDWKEKTVTFEVPSAGIYKVTVIVQSGDANAWLKVACNSNALWQEGHWCDGNWTDVTKTTTITLQKGTNTFVFGGNMKVKYVSCIITPVNN